jgi:hypothetical protein
MAGGSGLFAGLPGGSLIPILLLLLILSGVGLALARRRKGQTAK